MDQRDSPGHTWVTFRMISNVFPTEFWCPLSEVIRGRKEEARGQRRKGREEERRRERGVGRERVQWEGDGTSTTMGEGWRGERGRPDRGTRE